MSKDVILTGIRSNEEPTLGNLLGAIKPIAQLQKKFAGTHQINMFVPDLHSFTTPIDHSQLYQNTLENLKYFVAAGLDLDSQDTYLYRQSFIPAHSELTWILNCFTYVGEMSRMTQFKDKSASGNDSVSVGLFSYPVLMAADILLYNAKYVPVGEDQFQHLEITRDIASRINNRFGDLFTVPLDTKAQMKFLNRDNGLRIRSLSDPTKKMSKSSTDSKSKILLTDSADTISKKIMSAETDSLGSINFDWQNQPGVSNLLQIISVLSDQPIEQVVAQWQGNNRYGDLKKATVEVVSSYLSDFQAKLSAVSEDKLLDKLTSSEAAMNQVANTTLHRVQTAVGLRRG